MADIAVFVDSRGGNTRNVAEVIGKELGVTVGDLRTPLPADAKVLFLGSGTYGGAPGIEMQKFVTDNVFTGCKVALFGTALADTGAQKMIAAIESRNPEGCDGAGKFSLQGKIPVIQPGPAQRGRPG